MSRKPPDRCGGTGDHSGGRHAGIADFAVCGAAVKGYTVHEDPPEETIRRIFLDFS